MNVTLKQVVLAGLFVASLGLAGVAQAQPHIQPYLVPSPGYPSSPRLGFQGHFEWGYGMVVDYVPYGTPAARLGLESGDVIRAINGRVLQSQNDYYRALDYSGGYVQLVIQNVRTGGLVARSAYIGGSVAALQVDPGYVPSYGAGYAPGYGAGYSSGFGHGSLSGRGINIRW